MTSKALAFASSFALAGAALAQPTNSGGSEDSGVRHGGAFRQACQADIAKLCGDQPPGHGQIRQCLTAHSDQVSDACKAAIVQAQQWRDRRSSDGSAPGQPDGPPQPGPQN